MPAISVVELDLQATIMVNNTYESGENIIIWEMFDKIEGWSANYPQCNCEATPESGI